MQMRRMRAVLGGAFVLAIVATATASAAPSSGVTMLSGPTYNEARAVHSMADLAHASRHARALVTTPVVEIVDTKRIDPKTGTEYSARARAGCFDVWLSTTQLNI